MKKAVSVLLAMVMAGALAGCSSGPKAAGDTSLAAPSTAQGETSADPSGEETADSSAAPADSHEGEGAMGAAALRVGSLKGPTSMGLVYLMDQASQGKTDNQYEFTMVTAADELLAKVAAGDLDVALLPANVASVLYNKTQGDIAVIDINTLGVLDIVASDSSIQGIADLKGRTLYMTGKGTTPDYVFRYLLSANGMTEDDLTLEFKSEPAEVAAILKGQPDAVGLLPQPFVTAACAQNEALKIVLDLTEEWEKVQDGEKSRLVTGVTVVRKPFLEENPEAVALFLEDHRVSAEFTDSNPAEAAQLIAGLGIIEKAPVAQKALPYCNITCLTGEDMESALRGYLQVLFDQEPASVGGALPGDDFYYIP